MLFVQFSRCNFVYGFEEFSDLQCYSEMCKGFVYPTPSCFLTLFFFNNQYQMGTCIISADQMVFSLYFDRGLRIALVDLPPVLIPAWELEVV